MLAWLGLFTILVLLVAILSKRMSPLVALTSTTPSPTSRMETSKVPPPKS